MFEIPHLSSQIKGNAYETNTSKIIKGYSHQTKNCVHIFLFRLQRFYSKNNQ